MKSSELIEELEGILLTEKLSKIMAKRAIKIVKQLWDIDIEEGCLCTSTERAILKTKIKRMLNERR